MRRRYSRYSGRFPEYVPVAVRREKAARQINELKQKGAVLEPVQIEGRTIARSFWGKGWCTHLEGFGDYINRLPRGRTYVRNGMVAHLGMERGCIEAVVAGSELYRVRVEIEPLKTTAWEALKRQCTGQIGSLIELLQGRMSDEIMRAVTDPDQGLFPKPGEIRYTCNCPDWADMCKHVAAVMYGVGARLDTQPELLFKLRGVDHAELLSAEAAAGAIAGDGARRGRRRVLAEDELGAVFGVELEPDSIVEPERSAKPAKKESTGKPGSKAKQTGSRPHGIKKKSSRPFKPTGRSIANLRRRCGLTQAEMAEKIGVSAATVGKWEKTKGAVRPQARGLAGLQALSDSPTR